MPSPLARPVRILLAGALLFFLLAPGQSRAQDGPAGASASAQQADTQQGDDADAARSSLAEPSFRLVNLPTTLPLPRHGSTFDLVHRFNGNLAQNSFSENASNLFGLDQGAAIGIEYRFAFTSRAQAIVYRTNIDKTFQFSGRYDVFRQSVTMPASVSALVAVEGADNFQQRRSPSLGVAVTRTVGDVLAVHASPIWVHDTAALVGVERDTWLMGFGARLRVRPTVYVVGEASPRVGGHAPGVTEFSLAIEKRAGGHVFQLNVTNSQATTFGQLARGGFRDSLYLGFNLTRKFYRGSRPT
jgi:hypothetical protein